MIKVIDRYSEKENFFPSWDEAFEYTKKELRKIFFNYSYSQTKEDILKAFEEYTFIENVRCSAEKGDFIIAKDIAYSGGRFSMHVISNISSNINKVYEFLWSIRNNLYGGWARNLTIREACNFEKAGTVTGCCVGLIKLGAIESCQKSSFDGLEMRTYYRIIK